MSVRVHRLMQIEIKSHVQAKKLLHLELAELLQNFTISNSSIKDSREFR